MYTLIPEQNTKHLRFEYRLRFATLLLLFLSLSVWVGIVSLFPSYIVSVTEEGYALRQVSVIQTSVTSKTSTAINEKTNAINTFISAVSKTQDSYLLSNTIEDLVKRRIPGISYSSIELVRRSDSGSTIMLRGKAATRQSFQDFGKSLNADTNIERVVLPPSVLPQNRDINFALSIKSI